MISNRNMLINNNIPPYVVLISLNTISLSRCGANGEILSPIGSNEIDDIVDLC